MDNNYGHGEENYDNELEYENGEVAYYNEQNEDGHYFQEKNGLGEEVEYEEGNDYNRAEENVSVNEEEPIYIMTLELEKGRSERIKIYSDSNPYELAYNFCKDNDLDVNSLNYLQNEIETLMIKFKNVDQEVGEEENVHDAVEEDGNPVDIKENVQGDCQSENQFSHSRQNFHNFSHREQDQIIELEEEQNLTDKNKNEDQEAINSIEVEEEMVIQNIENIESLEGVDCVEGVGNNLEQIENHSEKSQENIQPADEVTCQEEKEPENKNELLYYTHSDKVTIEPTNDYKNTQVTNTKEHMFVYNSIENQNEGEEVAEGSNSERLERNEIYNYTDRYENNHKENNNSIKEVEEEHSDQLNNREEYKIDIEQREVEEVEVNEDEGKENSPIQEQEEENNDNDVNSINDLVLNQPENYETYEPKLFSYELLQNPKSSDRKEYQSHLSSQSNINNQNRNIQNLSSITNSVNLMKSPSASHFKEREKSQQSMNIFERLFRDAEIRRRMPKSKLKNRGLSPGNIPETNHNNSNFRRASSARHRQEPATNNRNYGEFLYYRGKLLKEERLRELAHKKSEMEEKESGNLTFKPQTNSHFPLPAHKTGNRLYSYNNLEHLRHKDHVIRAIREKNQKEEPPTQTFDSFKKSATKPNFPQRLYEMESQAERKLFKLDKLKQEIDKQFPFRPNINKNYQINANFEERQEIYKESSAKNKKRLEEDQKQLIDEQGYPLFKPNLISKSKYFNRNQLNLDASRDVFTQNYDYANRYRQNKQSLETKYNQIEVTKIQNDSDAIFNKVKEDNFRKIFRDLDTDQDDLITVQSIGVKNISKDILRIISPIIEELREENETLNEEEFVRAMTHLFDVLNYQDKKTLTGPYKYDKSFHNKYHSHIMTKHTGQQYNFKPHINKNSTKLAEKHNKRLTSSLSSNNLLTKNKTVDSNSFFKLYTGNSSQNLDDLQNYTFKNYKKNVIMNF